MSFKLSSVFAAVAGVFAASQARAMRPVKPTVAPRDLIDTGGNSKTSRNRAAANKRKAARYAKRSTKRARGHASSHASSHA